VTACDIVDVAGAEPAPAAALVAVLIALALLAFVERMLAK